MADNKSARVVNSIPATQSLDFSRPIALKGDKAIVKSISFTAAQLLGIDTLHVTCCYMANTRTTITHTVPLAFLTSAGIPFGNDAPNEQGQIGQVHESIMKASIASNGTVTLEWVYSAYLTVASAAYTSTTSNVSYGIVSVYGYQSFNLVDTYLKSETNALLNAKLNATNKQGYVTIGNATSGANGTQYPRTNWTSTVLYIGDTTNGGFGVLTGSLQCNVTENLTNTTKANTIYGFAPYLTASIRMCGHGTSASEDIWYGADGNNTIILNNSGQTRSYTQYTANTFAIPCQKKY